MSTYRTCLLKTRLIHHFGNALTFHRPQQRNVFEYVFSSKVSRGPIVEKCAKALKTLDNFKETAASMDIDGESPEYEESPGPTRSELTYAFVQMFWTAQRVSLFSLSQWISVTKRPVLKYRLRHSTSLHGFSLATTRRKVFLCIRG